MSVLKYNLFSNIVLRFSSQCAISKTRKLSAEIRTQLFLPENCYKNWFSNILKKELCTTKIVLMDFEFPEDELKKIEKRKDASDPNAKVLTPNPIVKGEPITSKENKYISSKKVSKKNYSKADDDLIIKYVESFGYNDLSFELAASKLDKSRWKFVKERYDWLMKKNGIELPKFEIKKVHTKKKFTDEEDKIIKEYVINYGYSIETFKRLSPELKRPRWEIIRVRYDTITNKLDVHDDKNKQFKSSQLKNRKRFTKEEDELILEYVKEHGCNSETLKSLANKLDRSNPETIRNRHLFLASDSQHKLKKLRKLKKRKDFTKEEDELILEYVKKHGCNSETLRYLANKLDRSRPETIRSRHRLIASDSQHKLKKLKKRKNFTKEEDELILEYVKKHGCNSETLKYLANKLDRSNPETIRKRHRLIASDSRNKPQIPKTSFSLEENATNPIIVGEPISAKENKYTFRKKVLRLDFSLEEDAMLIEYMTKVKVVLFLYSVLCDKMLI